MEDIDVDMYNITKRGSKVPGYEGRILPTHNIYGGKNFMEV